jgi:hypothetical protein
MAFMNPTVKKEDSGEPGLSIILCKKISQMKFFLHLIVLLATSINCFSQTPQDYYQQGNEKIKLNDYKATIQACD